MKTVSRQGWVQRHIKDQYVQKAQQDGFRSRAAYKLMAIDERDQLLRPGMRVLDLGAAPGSWSQYAIAKLGDSGKLLAVDLLPMDPLPGVEIIQGDFAEQTVLTGILNFFQAGKVDLVLSDMAPNLSGIATVDQAKSLYLLELALDCATLLLAPDGKYLFKIFQGAGFEGMIKQLRSCFKRVVIRKPKASRAKSKEVYVLASGLIEK